MQRFARYGFPAAAVLVVTSLAISIGPRLLQRAAMRRALDKWDIIELADHLDRAGLKLRVCSPQMDGVILRWAYLTTTDKGWWDLNRLTKVDHSRISEWRGTVYCERMNDKWQLVIDKQDKHTLVVGPFVFYGDVELLERIHAILTPDAPL